MSGRRLTIIFCLAYLAVHWLNQAIDTYGLMFDESQYWFWAKHPAFGYYSKPPMIAWLMGLSTAIFGDSSFGAKVFSPAILLGIGLLLRATALQLNYKQSTANWVLVTYLTLPIVTGLSMFFTTDVPLQFFWAMAMYSVVRALTRQDAARWWLLAGVATGFGFLSKYNMIAFGASTFFALLVLPQNRRWFTTPWPWLAAIVALALFAPNLWWNAQHQFVTFQHTDNNVFSKTIEVYPGDMLSFIASQFGIFGPVLLGALLLHLRYGPRTDTTRLLHCYIWPLALAGVVVALLASAQAHWISPAYLAATLLVVPWLESVAPRWLKLSLLLHLLVLAGFYLAPTIFAQLPPQYNPLTRAFVWNEIREPVVEQLKLHPDAVPMTNERKIATALTYALRDVRGYAEPVYKWKPASVVRDHYDLLTEQADLTGKPILLITHAPFTEENKQQYHLRQLTTFNREGWQFWIYYLPHYAGPPHAP